MAAPSGISQPKLNRNRIVFFFFGFVYANSSFPTTFLPEWSPLPPPQSLPSPSLPCMTLLSLHPECVKTLSRVSGIQQQALRNVSKPGGDQGRRETPEGMILGTGGPLCPDLLREVGAPGPSPYTLSLQCAHACTLTNACPISPSKEKGDSDPGGEATLPSSSSS